MYFVTFKFKVCAGRLLKSEPKTVKVIRLLL